MNEMTEAEMREYTRDTFFTLKPMTLPGVIPDPKVPAETYGEVIDDLKSQLDFCLGSELIHRNKTPDQQRLFFIWSLAETAKKISLVLERMSFDGKENAAKELCEVARAGVMALDRETHRGNEWISKILPHCTGWPIMYSPHNKIREQFTGKLEELQMGAKSLPSRPSLPWETSANRLVCAIYDYCSEVRFTTKAWETNSLRIDMEIEIPELARMINSLPDELNTENYLEWYQVGRTVLSEATNGEDRNHPAFENEALHGLIEVRDKWTDRIKDAWKNLAKAKVEPPRARPPN
ncbi:hypothetical protein OAG38_02425 [Akkermansiaceae bacterium]|nr:hypothetical protein [Akkermansiaceae bacterium]